MTRSNIILFAFIFFSSPVFAGNWCLRDPFPPCYGASGKCTRNSDGSKGGFVANTAYVQKTRYLKIYEVNKPFISIGAQVCENAHVADDARILESALISGRAQITGTTQIGGRTSIGGNIRIDESSAVRNSMSEYSGFSFAVTNPEREMGLGSMTHSTLMVPPSAPPVESEVPREPTRSDRRGVSSEGECSVCLDQVKNTALIPCGHRFCDGCVRGIKRQSKWCPTCRSPFTGELRIY